MEEFNSIFYFVWWHHKVIPLILLICNCHNSEHISMHLLSWRNLAIKLKHKDTYIQRKANFCKCPSSNQFSHFSHMSNVSVQMFNAISAFFIFPKKVKTRWRLASLMHWSSIVSSPHRKAQCQNEKRHNNTLKLFSFQL